MSLQFTVVAPQLPQPDVTTLHQMFQPGLLRTLSPATASEV